MARIQLDRVSLTFHVRRQQDRMTLKEYLVRGLFLREEGLTVKVPALRDVSLTVEAGERVGVLGPNGAGKSTLLKLLAGIYPPTRGKLLVEGKVSSLFDIALGLEPDASGRENIAYRGYLQGETPRSIRGKIDAIVEFAELGDFIHMPVRYYSAGMRVRLAFSIATAIDPEVLLIDEVLSAGDLAFQAKARARMRAMMERAKLLVVVSHDLGSLEQLCDRGIWLDRGRVVEEGGIAEVVRAYTEATCAAAPGAVEPPEAEGEPRYQASEELAPVAPQSD
jgi:ABC-type polysaccharide/polyol phosphate transport system ATPase subunit